MILKISFCVKNFKNVYFTLVHNFEKVGCFIFFLNHWIHVEDLFQTEAGNTEPMFGDAVNSFGKKSTLFNSYLK